MNPSAEPLVRFSGVQKTYDGEQLVVRSLDLDIQRGEFLSLLGPSGSGKTTLLRIIAGLEFPDRGAVLFDGEDATERSARDRRVGFVFQHYALFRHMTVFENVAFGLRVRPRRERPREDAIRKQVSELLELVQLGALGGRLPSQLSGGQRQRVALARALAVKPRVLLLDEPFGALDSRVRKDLRRWLRRIHEELGITSVFVTHDQEEALELADRVVVMDHGRIEQIGTPEQVYHEPASRFVYEFLGDVNVFHARLEDGPTRVWVRPHLLDLSREPSTNAVRAVVERVHAAGPTVKVELRTEAGERLQADLSQEEHRSLSLVRDEQVWVSARQSKRFESVEDYSI